MLASSDIVHQLIPQKNPMIMVDTLIRHDDQHTLTGFCIQEKNLFIEHGYFSSEGLLENMAQSAALRTGWIARQENTGDGDFSPPMGVIGAIKNFMVYHLPKSNTCITTEIVIQAEVMNATMISSRVMQDQDLLAEGELKIFLQ